MEHGLKIVEVQGPGSGREAKSEHFRTAAPNVTMIKDITPIPHNGCSNTEEEKSLSGSEATTVTVRNREPVLKRAKALGIEPHG